MENEMPNFDAPIPGENYTSDTKNYPWHRPPDITDYDQAIEFSMERLTEEEVGFTYMTMLEGGMSIATATDIFVTMGIANGKWTPDYAILIAGPVSRILEIMAKSYGIKAELGTESNMPRVTSAYLKAIREGDNQAAQEAAAAVQEEAGDIKAAMPTGGLMGAPATDAPAPEDEQLSMLGYGAEDDMAAEPMPEGTMPEEQEIQ